MKRFGTTTPELLDLADWLGQWPIECVAMESTGEYWKPVYNILEDQFAVMLVNAQHVKYVEGRKTDVQDAQWLAELLMHGLLRASFIPPQPQRILRDLTRYRTKVVQERARLLNRLQKVLEDANVKLAAVASDVLGKSGRAMLEAMLAGETDATVLANLARGRLRRKMTELEKALTGRMNDHHRFLLRQQLHHFDFLSQQEVTAQIIVAELGIDMSRFPTDKHAGSWSGMAPGNNESAGKRRSGRTKPGNKPLGAALSQAGWAASRSKGSYLPAQYQRIARRRGKKRAIVAESTFPGKGCLSP